MPFDSQGNFSRMHNWEQDRINGIEIITDHADEEDNNFAQGLNETFLRDGRVAMSGHLNMDGYRVKSLAKAQADSDAVNKLQLDNMGSEVTSALIDLINIMQPVGDIKMSAIEDNHGNWLLCDGQAVNREDYPELFDLIGTGFGSGNGVTTFNVPDYRGKFLRGLGGSSSSNIYNTQSEAVPVHTHFIANSGSGGSNSVTLTASNTLTSSGGASGTAAVAYYLNGSSTTASLGKTSGASASTYSGTHVTPINQAVYIFIKAKPETAA